MFIVMYLPDVNVQKVLRKPRRVKKELRKKVEEPKGKINFELRK